MYSTTFTLGRGRILTSPRSTAKSTYEVRKLSTHVTPCLLHLLPVAQRMQWTVPGSATSTRWAKTPLRKRQSFRNFACPVQLVWIVARAMRCCAGLVQKANRATRETSATLIHHSQQPYSLNWSSCQPVLTRKTRGAGQTRPHRAGHVRCERQLQLLWHPVCGFPLANELTCCCTCPVDLRVQQGDLALLQGPTCGSRGRGPGQ